MITQEQKREQFNRIIRGIDLVLMNNIAEVDGSVWDNFGANNPINTRDCEFKQDGKTWFCTVHEVNDGSIEDNPNPVNCEGYYEEQDSNEIYQWFAVGQSDAEFLEQHGQYITYSDLLDTHFLAITHFGTSWDYVDSMVDAFDDLYHEVDND